MKERKKSMNKTSKIEKERKEKTIMTEESK